MIKTIAGLQGVTVLGRDAQKKITGGQTCHIRITNSSFAGGAFNGNATYLGSNVENFCSDMIELGGGRCQYDCADDGYTASWWS